MGISCEISLCRPADGRYIFQPGSIVSGGIRYYLDQEYEFTSITVSLKGIGKLYFEDKTAKRRNRMYQYSNAETYVDIDNIIHTKEKEETLPVGQYDTQFSFQLPYNIPATFECIKETFNYRIDCRIKYYVRIKFERPGRFNMNKHYKKEINVISGQIPRMTTKPLVYGDRKRLIQLSSLFSSNKGVVNLKATIANSVLRPGDTVKVDYEIENNTSVDIKQVEVRLLEVDIFKASFGGEAKDHSEVEGTGFTYGAIQSEETANFPAEIVIPNLCASIDHSNIVSRNYSILTIVVLPKPHINMQLEIPFQVVAILSTIFEENGASSSTSGYVSDEPPTYWEAMGEETNKFDEKEGTSSSTSEQLEKVQENS